MSRLRVQCFAISIDGYGAGASQDLQNPLGVRGPELFDWLFATRVWRRMHGHEDGETGVDDGVAEQGMAGLGAWILGRNMFGPVRGPWPDESWKGWWGMSRRITGRSSSSPTILGHRSRWPGTRSSSSSATALRPPSSGPPPQQVAATYASAGVCPRSDSICRRG